MGRGTRKRVSPKLKFQVVMESLTGSKTTGQIGKTYGVHPHSIGLWRKTLMERGAEVFESRGRGEDHDRRVAELEQLIGRKEVEIALLKNFLGRNG
jgi:transposase